MALKLCTKCRSRREKNATSFPVDATSPDGFADICNACVNNAAAELLHSQGRIASAEADARMRTSLVAGLAKSAPISPDENFTPHVTDLYEALMREMGGASGFGLAFVSQFLAAKPGSPTRTKLLGDVAKLGMFVTSEGGARKLEDMGDDELRAAEERIVKRLEKRLSPPATVSAAAGVPTTTEPERVESSDENTGEPASDVQSS